MLLPYLLVVPAVLAQAPALQPVDYEALRQDFREANAFLQKERSEYAKAKKPMAEFRPSLDQALAPLRAKVGVDTGELRDAARVAEVQIHFSLRLADRKTLGEALMKEVPASSPAWKLSPPLAFTISMELKESAEAKTFLAAVLEQGSPEVRQTTLALQVEGAVRMNKLDEARTTLARLQREFPDSPSAKRADALVQGATGTQLGGKAPNFALTDLDDASVKLTLDTFKGKYLLLDFWGTWCTWCVQELPTTHKLYETYKARGLEILSMATDMKEEDVRAFRKKPGFPMPWRHAYIGTMKAQDPVAKDYGVSGYPALFLIGPDGRILAKGESLREKELEKTLEKHLVTAPASR